MQSYISFWLKRTCIYFHIALGVRSLKWMCRALFLPEPLEENPFLCLFHFFRGHLHPAVVLSFSDKSLSHLCLLSHLLSSSCLPLSLIRTLCVYSGLAWRIQDDLPFQVP